MKRVGAVLFGGQALCLPCLSLPCTGRQRGLFPNEERDMNYSAANSMSRPTPLV